MYVQVARKLVVDASAPSFSQAVSMDGANAAFVELTCFYYSVAGSSTKCTVTLEVGNDLENWIDASGASDKAEFTADGFDTFDVDGVAAQYCRLRFEISGSPLLSGTVIFAAGVNTSDQ